MTPASDRIGRRTFLLTAVAGGLAALCGDWWAQWRVAASPALTPFPIAGAAELLPGEAVSFSVPATAITGVLVRLNRDTYAAFDRRCPHLGCPVQWSAARAGFACPCHGAAFDGLTGGVLAGPPRRGLRRIATERRGDQVWVVRAGAEDEGEERGV